MFDQLSTRLKGVFDKIASRGLLTEGDVDNVLRDVRIALLEADVALPVIKQFMAKVRVDAVGEKVLKAVKPGEQVVKVVHDALVDVLGAGEPLNLRAQAPVVILMAGLQGSGKTTTSAKLAKFLREKEHKKVLLASLDVYRPAAQEQLATVARQAGAESLPIIADQQPPDITRRALDEARRGGYDILILDTAGRLQVDAAMMAELEQVKKLAAPTETLLVADSLTGQVAVEIATAFHEQIGITGIILTRIDGDGRGGAALSMRAVTGQPIKFLGTGENIGGLSPFSPDRLAGRILGMGDVVELVERAQQAMSEEDAAGMQEKMFSGQFTLEDLKKQLKMMRKMGSMTQMLDLIPGMGKFKDKIDPSKLDDKAMNRQVAIIDSMTPKERRNPDILNAKRRKRVAAGAGVSVHDVNKLIKSYDQMRRAMKQLKKMGGIGALGKLMGGGKPPFGGMPSA